MSSERSKTTSCNAQSSSGRNVAENGVKEFLTGHNPEFGVFEDGKENVSVGIERNGEQVLITVEIDGGPEASVVSAVDASDVSTTDAVEIARRLRWAHQPVLEDQITVEIPESVDVVGGDLE